MERKNRTCDDRFLHWKAEYSVNIDAIDRQHQILVGFIRQLQEAMEEGRGRAFQSTLIDNLVAYTQGHFRFEEDLMREQGYELLAEHIVQHGVLTTQVRTAGEDPSRQHDIERCAHAVSAPLVDRPHYGTRPKIRQVIAHGLLNCSLRRDRPRGLSSCFQ